MTVNTAVRGSVEAIDSERYRRCVIYTRKSSEEGLDQDFNSLHAQREACEAYVQSQRHEGWRLLRDEAHLYDDGGLSGGNMDRPGLIGMLAAIEAGQIDVIVVYKVDRLTRSLADFARIVDVLDKHNVSFVSVTQAFNTTSSMGRLTLNVLLSFARFEREVTAERIRDKIAASKRKGMWMGGPVPLGYRVENRKLVIDYGESKILRRVFETYLRTRSLPKTKAELDEAGFVTRQSIRKSGKSFGGNPFSCSGLSAILRNRVYRGMISHKGEMFDGEHDALIDKKLFEAVQTLLNASSGGNKRQTSKAMANQPGRLLKGKVYNSAGFAMTTTHTKRNGVRHNYYLSTALAKNRKAEAGIPHRVPAVKLEAAVIEALRAQIKSSHGSRAGTANSVGTIEPGDLINQMDRIDVTKTGAIVTLRGSGTEPSPRLTVSIDWAKPVRRQRLLPNKSSSSARQRLQTATNAKTNQRLVRSISRAHQWYDDIKNGAVFSIDELATREQRSVRSIRLTLTLAWLAPDIVRAALNGQIDPTLSATELARSLPSDWVAQRRMLGLG